MFAITFYFSGLTPDGRDSGGLRSRGDGFYGGREASRPEVTILDRCCSGVQRSGSEIGLGLGRIWEVGFISAGGVLTLLRGVFWRREHWKNHDCCQCHRSFFFRSECARSSERIQDARSVQVVVL